MTYKVIKESNGSCRTLQTTKDYNQALHYAISEAKCNSSSEFHSEIQEALEDRGYYMCGWSSTKIIIEIVN